MKINEIIFEDKGTQYQETVIAPIEKHCQPYLSAIGGIDHALLKYPLYRGIPNMTWPKNKLYTILPVNQKRTPRDSPLPIHNAADDWFNYEFTIRFRSAAVFCTGSWNVASDYGNDQPGNLALVIPVGKFDYCWSPEFADMARVVYNEYQTTDGTDVKRLTDSVLNSGEYLFNEGLREATKSGHEIMVACKKVLLIDESKLYKW